MILLLDDNNNDAKLCIKMFHLIFQESYPERRIIFVKGFLMFHVMGVRYVSLFLISDASVL